MQKMSGSKPGGETDLWEVAFGKGIQGKTLCQIKYADPSSVVPACEGKSQKKKQSPVIKKNMDQIHLKIVMGEIILIFSNKLILYF